MTCLLNRLKIIGKAKKKCWAIVAVVWIFFGFVLPDSSMATMLTYIPGAHNVMVQRFDDLTTNNPAIGHLSELSRFLLYANDWSPDGKTGKKPAWYTPKEKIPGLQIEGFFADSRFVIRIPDQWNGKLVMAGIPGVFDDRSADDVFSDYVVTKKDSAGRSFAYAATDKGTTGEVIFQPRTGSSIRLSGVSHLFFTLTTKWINGSPPCTS